MQTIFPLGPLGMCEDELAKSDRHHLAYLPCCAQCSILHLPSTALTSFFCHQGVIKKESYGLVLFAN